MAKWVCSVCGYVHEGDTPPEKCPQCGEYKRSHRLCPSCGYYNGRQVVAVED